MTSPAASRLPRRPLPVPRPDHRPARLLAVRAVSIIPTQTTQGDPSSPRSLRPCRMLRRARMLRGAPRRMDRARLHLSQGQHPRAIDSSLITVGTTLCGFLYSLDPMRRPTPPPPPAVPMPIVPHPHPSLQETMSLPHPPHPRLTHTPHYLRISLCPQQQPIRQLHLVSSRTQMHAAPKTVLLAPMRSRCS